MPFFSSHVTPDSCISIDVVKDSFSENGETFLTHFQPIFYFYNPWKHEKAYGFLMFSGIREVEQWLKMG